MLKQFHQKHLLETGCDEAGRGCLAGPVYAAAVILPIDFYHPLLNDSKQLTESQRNLLRPIIEKEAIDFAYVPSKQDKPSEEFYEEMQLVSQILDDYLEGKISTRGKVFN